MVIKSIIDLIRLKWVFARGFGKEELPQVFLLIVIAILKLMVWAGFVKLTFLDPKSALLFQHLPLRIAFLAADHNLSPYPHVISALVFRLIELTLQVGSLTHLSSLFMMKSV